MKVGAIFPQTEIGIDTGAIKEYAQATESLGYDFLLAFDHVLGANEAHPHRLDRPYRHYDMFHEPFVLFGYLAAVTESVELATGIIILPQRQTALVAKQAAAVDVLSGGRLRLGIGVGWNHVEFEALGENWRNRGRRSEEQIEVMRQLWTNELITFNGKWHTITDAGILPLPIQRPIPVWLGGRSDRTIRRIVDIGDGWILTGRPDDGAKAAIDSLHAYAAEAGRDAGEHRHRGLGIRKHRRRGRLGERGGGMEGAGRNACVPEHDARRLGLARRAHLRHPPLQGSHRGPLTRGAKPSPYLCTGGGDERMLRVH